MDFTLPPALLHFHSSSKKFWPTFFSLLVALLIIYEKTESHLSVSAVFFDFTFWNKLDCDKDTDVVLFLLHCL